MIRRLNRHNHSGISTHHNGSSSSNIPDRRMFINHHNLLGTIIIKNNIHNHGSSKIGTIWMVQRTEMSHRCHRNGLHHSAKGLHTTSKDSSNKIHIRISRCRREASSSNNIIHIHNSNSSNILSIRHLLICQDTETEAVIPRTE